MVMTMAIHPYQFFLDIEVKRKSVSVRKKYWICFGLGVMMVEGHC